MELLRAQLKHEREVVLYTVGMAVGASFLVFALTVGLTVVLTEKTIPVLWVHMITAYLLVGGLVLIASVVLFVELKYSERRDLERIRKKYRSVTHHLSELTMIPHSTKRKINGI